jgi:hypothetical protein
MHMTIYYVTYSDGVFADKSLQTTGAVADGKGGAILHIGARFAAVVAMVNSYMYIIMGMNRVFNS